VLPRLQQEGRDPSSKDVYAGPEGEVKKLAEEFHVDYNTAKKAYDKVLRDVGAKPPPAPAPMKSTTGGVTTEIKGGPKQGPPAQLPKQELQDQGPPPEEKKRLATAAAAKLFAGMHKGTADFLYSLADAAWGMKIARPDVDKDGKVIPINDEANPYYSAGSMWADVIDAYDIEMSKVMVLLFATVNTGQVIVSPLLMAQAEAGRLKKEKEAAEKKAAKEKENQPVVGATPA
jgi:hypothetical protein